MAPQSGRKTTSGKGSNRKTSSRSKTKRQTRQEEQFSAEVREEIALLLGIAITVLLFLCNFHIIGKVGNAISSVMFGLFGIFAYIAPLLIFFAILFGIINLGSYTASIKLGAAMVLFLDLEMIFAIFAGVKKAGTTAKDFYHFAATHIFSGGVVGGLLAKGLSSIIGIVGTIAVAFVIIIIALVLLTEKSFVKGVAGRSRRVYDTAREDIDRRKQLNEEYRERRREEKQRRLEELEEELELEEQRDVERKKRRMDQRVSGVASDITLGNGKKKKLQDELERDESNFETKRSASKTKKIESSKSDLDELESIVIKGISDASNDLMDSDEELNRKEDQLGKSANVHRRNHKVEIVKKDTEQFDVDAISEALVHSTEKMIQDDYSYRGAYTPAETITQNNPVKESFDTMPKATEMPKTSLDDPQHKVELNRQTTESGMNQKQIQKPVAPQQVVVAKPRPYKKPPIHLLKRNENSGNKDSEMQLKETALQLKQTLKTFGVNVTITDISQGPAVTRYELQPEMGVKVSKIVNLADDIKLNLAATDIRIEAPIPGKAAIGIEVPNKENSMVMLRDLIDTKTFKDFESKIAFAVGKDIAGQTIVTDIGKMPHVLIAGSTGSGKSVCINTLIMSILYKASPEEVKLIMVDPKVVELSVYNGIPHLLLPVVTDPKKASAALQWGVKEMTDRYKKFEDMHVRDLKGYNKKVEEMTENDGQPLPEKLPQIVIIVDELADLMMVAPGEVEESICRLAQLARAAGIHLVIATQRPSVDVITGLIKANMPSRVAFAVSSGVDSRTILDMVGAEKLLGKGDMLFYPQGYPKPVRVQGAFVSDKEVADVVDYILANNDPASADAIDIQQQMNELENSSSAGGSSSGGLDDRDQYFADAGRFVIEKDKASIGMLQRVFKIGFNRAARIMDQLCDYGVVGEEEGTKPRRVLMTMAEFEQLLEEI